MTQTAETLFTRFGTTSPRWVLRRDSDTLALLNDSGETLATQWLTPVQAGNIRKLTGTTRAVELDIQVGETSTQMLLVGKRADIDRWTGFAADSTNTFQVAKALEGGLAYAEQVVAEVHSLVVIIDQHGKLKRLNRLCEELSGLKEEDLIGRNAHDLFMPEAEHEGARQNIAQFFETGESWAVERPIRTRDGVRQVLWRNKFVKGGPEEGTYLICSGLDITEEREAKRKLIELATTDTLTGLPNRHAVQTLISERLAGSPTPFAVMFLDLDNFKQVNDHYGHVKGDQLICAVAKLVQQSLREKDVLARLGGDELLLVLDNVDAEAAQAVAGRILERLRQPVQLAEVELYTNCSIGIALAPEHGNTMDELIRNADTAMYCAKDKGKGAVQLFSANMNEKARQYIWLDSQLRKAIGANQMELHYQPKVCLQTGRVLSVEALIRWTHPERGAVSPMAFIPYAEESGIIHELGAWVIAEAARQARAWQEEGHNLRVAVNISARQLGNDDVLTRFSEALQATGQARSLLDIELTESCLAHDEAFALSLINRFKALGAEVHLDDFGTGYSSLSQLVRMPVDVLKMDRSFIRNLCTDPRSRALVRSVVAVSEELGCKLVAEGVETEEQAALLKELGVGQAQGYLYAKPMPAALLSNWMVERAAQTKLRRVA